VVDEDSCPDDWWSFLGTQSAERMLGEEELAGAAPSSIVATLRGGTSVLVILSSQLLFMD